MPIKIDKYIKKTIFLLNWFFLNFTFHVQFYICKYIGFRWISNEINWKRKHTQWQISLVRINSSCVTEILYLYRRMKSGFKNNWVKSTLRDNWFAIHTRCYAVNVLYFSFNACTLKMHQYYVFYTLFSWFSSLFLLACCIFSADNYLTNANLSIIK
jgi:hypothetical protein